MQLVAGRLGQFTGKAVWTVVGEDRNPIDRNQKQEAFQMYKCAMEMRPFFPKTSGPISDLGYLSSIFFPNARIHHLIFGLCGWIGVHLFEAVSECCQSDVLRFYAHLPLATSESNINESAGICDSLLRAPLGSLLLLLRLNL